MIQSRFQGQHQSKHPQKPENGGSGPIAASRDATDNIKRSGPPGAKAEDVKANRQKAADYTADAARSRATFPEDPMPRAWPGEEWTAHAAEYHKRTANEGQARIDKADSAIHVLMNDTRAGDAKGARERFMEFSRDNLLRGRTRGQKKTK